MSYDTLVKHTYYDTRIIIYYTHYEYTTRCFHPSAIALEGGRTAALEEAHEAGPEACPRSLPFCVTYYDFESETDGCVTIRERDSMSQKGMQAQPPIEEYSWTKGTAAGKPDS